MDVEVALETGKTIVLENGNILLAGRYGISLFEDKADFENARENKDSVSSKPENFIEYINKK